MGGHFIDERAYGPAEAYVIESGLALCGRGLPVPGKDPRDQRFACLFDIGHDAPFLSRSGISERFEEPAPVACAVEYGAHFSATRAVAIQPPMFQFDACTILAIRNESHLNLRFQR